MGKLKSSGQWQSRRSASQESCQILSQPPPIGRNPPLESVIPPKSRGTPAVKLENRCRRRRSGHDKGSTGDWKRSPIQPPIRQDDPPTPAPWRRRDNRQRGAPASVDYEMRCKRPSNRVCRVVYVAQPQLNLG
ncbi:hypothetical protein EVAR_23905_1 [Eumeta japonica]|uniref:Uncharacterized protein n=1 Tax=Eumeta variegata TaxID=151549 RepID=A0A4C1V5E9_EUMVA|nr:hypothetical protein EVAR_23905_1 [Eumeta japonica]